MTKLTTSRELSTGIKNRIDLLRETGERCSIRTLGAWGGQFRGSGISGNSAPGGGEGDTPEGERRGRRKGESESFMTNVK